MNIGDDMLENNNEKILLDEVFKKMQEKYRMIHDKMDIM